MCRKAREPTERYLHIKRVDLKDKRQEAVIVDGNDDNDDYGGGGGHFVHFVEILKFWSDLGAGVDFLGVALVEYIDKGSMFGLDTASNR